jgi:TPR repeat protein
MIPKISLLLVLFAVLGASRGDAATALGLDTAEWTKPSAEMVAHVEALEAAIAASSKGEAPVVPLQQSIDKIRELAEAGKDKDALFSMGVLIQQSNQPNAAAEANAYYKKAADLGQLQGMNNYGFILAASNQDPAVAQDGIGYIKQASDGGLNAARRNMAAIHLNGLGGEKRDPAAAQALLEKAAGEKDNQAAFELAQFYLESGGADFIDDDKAWDWLNKAADAGNPGALASLGSVLFDGKKFGARQIEADPAKAVALFTKLADQGVPAGLRTMGELHASGLAGVEKNFTKSLEYFSRAAQGNDAAAQVTLAGYYGQGVDLDPADGKIEVAPNPAAALELYRLAARNNVPLALYNVGVHYEEGRSVDKDPTKAFAAYLGAAGGGFAPAMQKAGVYYLNGAGTLQDAVAAAGWFTRAAAAGMPEGLLSLGVMSESGLLGASPEVTPAKAASDAYLRIIELTQVADATRFEALLRQGGLQFRGLLVPAGEAPKPDYESAYRYFKFAEDLAPENELAVNTVKEAAGKLTAEQIAKLDAEVAESVAARKKALSSAAPAGEQAPAPAPSADAPAKPAAAAPVERAAAPVAAPSQPAAAPVAAPTAPEAAPAEKKAGFRLPGFGR